MGKKHWGYSVYLGFSLIFFMTLFFSCKLTVMEMTLPDRAGTGEVVTLILQMEVADSEDGVNEIGIAIEIPDEWEVLYADIEQCRLTEQEDLEGLYTNASGYRTWVGTVRGDPSTSVERDSVTATVKLLTANFSQNPGEARLFSIKSSTGAFREGSWVADDPADVFDFAEIDDAVRQKWITVTQESEDEDAPAAVTQLTVEPPLFSCECAPEAYLHWEEYDVEGEKDVVSFNIYYSDAYTVNREEMVQISQISTGYNSFSADDLVAGTIGYFAVVAVDEMGNENEWVDPVSFEVPLASQLNVAVKGENGEPLINTEIDIIYPFCSVPFFEKMTYRTDSDGVVELDSLCDGTYLIEVGEETRSVDIDHAVHSMYEIEFLLPVDVMVTTPDSTMIVSSGQHTKLFGTSGADDVVIESGANVKLIHFPGANQVTVESEASLFSVYRSGATVYFVGSDGTWFSLPATEAPQSIVFNDVTRILQIDAGQIRLGDQVIGIHPSGIDID